MPKVGEGKSVRINPDVYEALLLRKHGMMSMSDTIKALLPNPVAEATNIIEPLPLPEPEEI